ncbi:MAG: DUF1349 domain-containing protein [Sphaerochaetaceae bacterium]|jgi:regulation of enolase protein 1 (concanavalin A-like superfamily)
MVFDEGGFSWLNKPAHRFSDNSLEITTHPETNLWQGTHSGFRRDNAHIYVKKVREDFLVRTNCFIKNTKNFDQGGLTVRLDKENWITLALAAGPSGKEIWGIVTNNGYSDWSRTLITNIFTQICLRVQGKGSDFLLEYSLDKTDWNKIRIAHLHTYRGEALVGVFACSPKEGASTKVDFNEFEIGQRIWVD